MIHLLLYNIMSLQKHISNLQANTSLGLSPACCVSAASGPQERTQVTASLEEERRNNSTEQQRLQQVAQSAQVQVESLQKQVSQAQNPLSEVSCKLLYMRLQ